MKDLVKKHILTICAAISVISMAFPFVVIKTTMEIWGNSGSSQVTTNGFSSISKSIFAVILIIGPVLIATMNYIKPIEKYKGILAIAIPVICIIVMFIVFLQVKGASISASGGGGMVNADVKASLGIGAIIALVSYLGTIVAGAITYHNFRFDKESLERIKSEGVSLAKNFSEKVSDTVQNVTASASNAINNVTASASNAVNNQMSTTTEDKASSPAERAQSHVKASKINLSRADEILSLIEKLNKMKNEGILTEEEFAEKKKSLLEEI